jgi:hypothetical protein
MSQEMQRKLHGMGSLPFDVEQNFDGPGRLLGESPITLAKAVEHRAGAAAQQIPSVINRDAPVPCAIFCRPQ